MSIEAMKQALEACKKVPTMSVYATEKLNEVEAILGQAIEQAQKQIPPSADSNTHQQEPVGFMCQGCFYELDDVDEYCDRKHVYLYTHPSPPQRQPLTDEEIDNIRLAVSYAAGLERFALITRAIEAAHGIKGEA